MSWKWAPRPCKDPAKTLQRPCKGRWALQNGPRAFKNAPRAPQRRPKCVSKSVWERAWGASDASWAPLGRLRGPKMDTKWWQNALQKGIGNGFRIWCRFSNDFSWFSDFVAMVNCWNYAVKMGWFWTFAFSFHKIRRFKNMLKNQPKTAPKLIKMGSKWSPERIRSALVKRNGQ